MSHLPHCVRVLHRAGMVRAHRPDRALRSLVDVRAWGPLLGSVRRAVRERPDAAAVIDETGPCGYADLHGQSMAPARALHAAGIGAEHVVAVLCRNHRGPVEAMLACARLGARVLLLNTGFAGPQPADVVRRERAVALVHDDEFEPVLAEVAPAVARFATSGFDELIDSAPDREPPRPVRPGGVVPLTSGTTGAPKGAHREVRSPFAAVDFLDRVPLRSGEVTVIAAPVFHGIGFAHPVLAMGLGSAAVLTRAFDASRTVAPAARHRATALVLVPTVLRRVLDLGPLEPESHDLSALRVVLSSGADLPAPLTAEATRRFGDVVHDLYGSTEFGQRLRAFAVPVPGARVDPEELKPFVRDRLARHKVPREVVLTTALPRNETGKVLRRLLR